MDDTKLKKIGAELSKARVKRDEWDRKVKDLERKYREAENTCFHDMVHAANLSPEDLAELIKKAFQAAPVGDAAAVIHQNEEEESDMRKKMRLIAILSAMILSAGTMSVPALANTGENTGDGSTQAATV